MLAVQDLVPRAAFSTHVVVLAVYQAGELRGHEDGHDGAAQPRIDLELLGGVVGDHDRQEVEHALPDGFHEYPACGNLVIRNDVQRNKQVDQRDDDGAPSSTPRIGRKESERYSKKESSHATLPRALERASALTSALLFCLRRMRRRHRRSPFRADA